MKRALQWLGRKLRGPIWIVWHLLMAVAGNDPYKFTERKKASPARRLMWRLLLTLVLLVKLPFVFALWAMLCVVAGLGGPFAAVGLFAYGNAREIWRSP